MTPNRAIHRHPLIVVFFLIASFFAFFGLCFYKYRVSMWSEYYYALSVFAVFCLLVKSDWRNLFPVRRSNGFFLFVLVFIVAFAYRLKMIDQVSLWLDEDFQLNSVMDHYAVHGALEHHQPPFNFSSTFFFMKIFGLHVLPLRLTPAVFSALATALIVLLARQLSRSVLIALFCGALFSFHSVVTVYGYEARCISAGFVGALVVLSFATDFVRGGVRLELTHWIYCLAGAYLALLCLGMQVPILLLSLSLVFLFWPRKSWREKVFLLSALAGAVVLFLPIQYTIIKIGTWRFDRASHFKPGDLLGQFRWENFSFAWDLYFRPILPSLLFMLIFGIAVCMINRSRNKATITKPSWPSVFLFLMASVFLFALILIPFFRALVDWHLNTYYIALVWPVLVLALGAVYGWATERVSQKYAVLTSVLVSLSLTGLFLFDSDALEGYLSFEPHNFNYKAAYETVQRDYLDRKVMVFNFCLNRSDQYCPAWLIGSQVYLRPKSSSGSGFYYFPERSTGPWVMRFFQSDFEPDDIALLFEKKWSNIDLPADLTQHFPGLRVKVFDGVTLLLLQNRNRQSRNLLLSFFEHLARYADNQGTGNTGLLTVLIAGNHRLGNQKTANRYYQEGLAKTGFNDQPERELLNQLMRSRPPNQF